jgi:hypothetical protein
VVLQVFTKYDLTFCEREIAVLEKAVNRVLKPAMHSKHHVAFVITTGETPRQLVARIAQALDQECFIDWWAFSAMRNTVGKFGNLDSLTSRVELAYATISAQPEPAPAFRRVKVEVRRARRFPKLPSLNRPKR